MATDYGVDVACSTDIDVYFTLASGVKAVSDAIARRLQTPRGGLIDDSSYGYDLRQLVNTPLTNTFEFEARTEIEAQCLLDERVDAVEVTITQEAETLEVVLFLTLVQNEEFSLVLSVDQVSVTVLEAA